MKKKKIKYKKTKLSEGQRIQLVNEIVEACAEATNDPVDEFIRKSKIPAIAHDAVVKCIRNMAKTKKYAFLRGLRVKFVPDKKRSSTQAVLHWGGMSYMLRVASPSMRDR